MQYIYIYTRICLVVVVHLFVVCVLTSRLYRKVVATVGSRDIYIYIFVHIYMQHGNAHSHTRGHENRSFLFYISVRIDKYIYLSTYTKCRQKLLL